MIVYDGLNNLTWFIGLVEAVDDPIKAGRIKVRAFGFHPTIEENTVDTDDLPWATVLGLSSNFHAPINIGEFVFGAFLDGRDAQQPLVFGILPAPKFSIPATSRGTGGGAGQSGQVGSSGVASFPTNGVGPLSQTDVANLQSAMLQRESSGNYQVINGLGYVGGYQFGAGALQDLGYVNPGTTNSMLSDPNVWTGQNGMGSLDSFLNAPSVQDQAFVDYSQINYNRLYQNGVINESTPVSDVAGYIAAAHLLGAGGVNNGLSNVDGNGITGYEYFNLGSTAVNAGYAVQGAAGGPIPPTNPHLKNSPEVIENLGNLAVLPQVSGEDQHKTPDAPAILSGKSYTSNTVNIYHPGVPASGSYNTSVIAARYDGSNITVIGGSSKDTEAIKIMHRTGAHIILDQNGNVTINSVGKVQINSDNDYEELVEGAIKNVSKGGYSIKVDGAGLTMHSSGDMNITSGSNINLEAAGDIRLNSGGSLDIGSSRVGLTTQTGDISFKSAANIQLDSVGKISNKAVNIISQADSVVSKSNSFIANVNNKGIDIGGNVTILGTRIDLNDGSIGSVDDVAAASGAVNMPAPPAHEASKTTPSPTTPGTIGSNHIDDVEQ